MSETASRRVSVIIPTFQRGELLRNLLDDLARQQDVRGEVIVVDQNNPPLGKTLAHSVGGKLGCLELRVIERAPGVVAARNAALDAATGEIVVFLDDDVRVGETRFLRNHVANYEDPQVAAVCGQELVPPDFTTIADGGEGGSTPFEMCMFFSRNSTRRCQVCALSTCNCSVRASAMKAVRGFDPAYRGNSYGDDADLALRLHASGFRIIFDPSASVRHLKALRGGLRLSDDRNPSKEVEKYVSAWVFFFRHVPAGWSRWYLWHGILRKSLLLRNNFARPHRWPRIVAGLWGAFWEGRRAVESGRAR